MTNDIQTSRLSKLLLGILLCLAWSSAIAGAPQQPREAGNQNKSAESPNFRSLCSTASVGESIFSERNLVEFVRGDSELILAAPHGGRLAPEDFPVRTNADAVTASDWNTDQLARGIWDAVQRNEAPTPHLIICHAHRKFIDTNRPLDAACASDSPARTVWRDYQTAIAVAKEMVVQSHGRGLFVELHGHGHPEQQLELGYLLRSRDFELPPAEFVKLGQRSSLREVSERGNTNLEELLRGSQSLGYFLAKQGIRSMPSPENPRPGKEPYFNGGWNTMTHGSRDAGTISSLQIECHRSGFRDTSAEVDVSSKKVASALLEFLHTHYARSESRATDVAR